MPITRRQFDLGISSTIEGWMRDIYEFLSSRPNEAFSQEELETLLGIKQVETERERFFAALDKLVETNVVKQAMVEGDNYYAPGRFTIDDILYPGPL